MGAGASPYEEAGRHLENDHGPLSAIPRLQKRPCMCTRARCGAVSSVACSHSSCWGLYSFIALPLVRLDVEAVVKKQGHGALLLFL